MTSWMCVIQILVAKEASAIAMVTILHVTVDLDLQGNCVRWMGSDEEHYKNSKLKIFQKFKAYIYSILKMSLFFLVTLFKFPV